MMRASNRRLRHLPIRMLAPNILTVLALCAGMTAMRFALQERWELAVTAVAIAGIFDGLDGRVARLLKGTSKFGAELDSLSDFVSFGVAPGVLLYLWSLSALGGFGWIVVLGFAVCCALRLARFNTALDDPDRPVWAANFFTGVPAPAGAFLALLPLVASFQMGDAYFRSPWLAGLNAAIVAFLMVSRVPTFSFKRVRVPRDWVLPVLVFVGLVAAMAMSYPWESMLIVGAAYIATLPLAVLSWRRQVRQARDRALAHSDEAMPPLS
jgi:CDP-diacylglycerol--serine O-phosphatidyltransferase